MRRLRQISSGPLFGARALFRAPKLINDVKTILIVVFCSLTDESYL